MERRGLFCAAKLVEAPSRRKEPVVAPVSSAAARVLSPVVTRKPVSSVVSRPVGGFGLWPVEGSFVVQGPGIVELGPNCGTSADSAGEFETTPCGEIGESFREE